MREANQIDRSTLPIGATSHLNCSAFWWQKAPSMALCICLGRWSLGTSVVNFHGFDDMIWHDFPRGTCPCLWRVLRKSTASNMLWKKVLMVNHGCVKRPVTPHLANESTQCNLATAPRSWRKSWETRKMRMQRYLRETLRLGSMRTWRSISIKARRGVCSSSATLGAFGCNKFVTSALKKWLWDDMGQHWRANQRGRMEKNKNHTSKNCGLEGLIFLLTPSHSLPSLLHPITSLTSTA